MTRLDNKVAIVTGASKGIGAGIAKAFGAEGAAVVVNYARDHEAAELVVREITGKGGRAAAAGVGNSYMILIASRLARVNGWTEEQVAALRTGASTNDAKIDELAGLVREAAANSGNVTDATWKAAQQAGWNNEQLADAFAYLGATVFTAYFLNYAQTDLDL